MSKEKKVNTFFKVKDDWSRNGGFKGEISLTNKGKSLEDWTLEFDADFEITKIWNAEIVSHVGDRYVIKSGRWNNELDAGESTSFGFNASIDDRTIHKPSNYTFNQQQLDVSPQPSNVPSPSNNNNDHNASVNTLFKVKKDWNGGFKGEINLTNKGNSLEDWTLEFDADFEITKIWNAKIVSHVGDRYVIKGSRWNNDLNKGKSTSFGFNASIDDRTIDKPSNYTLNQQQLDKSPTPSPKDNRDILPPKPTQSPLPSPSSQAITVGFEHNNDGAKYNRSAQSKDWNVDWSDSKWMNNYAFVSDDEAHSQDQSLRITYLPDQKTGGSAAWELPAQKEYYLSYWVKFEDDFSFNGSKQNGGKLPGLAGAGGYCSGGQNCNGDNGFSTRYMWRKDGQVELYVYHMNKPTKWGENYWLKDNNGQDVHFETDKWHNLTQRVKMNDGSRSNGEIDVWMDGKQVLDLDGMKFVTNNKGIDGLLFSTFHGGQGSQWYPDHKQYAYFDDFVVSTNPSDVGL